MYPWLDAREFHRVMNMAKAPSTKALFRDFAGFTQSWNRRGGGSYDAGT